MKDLKVIIGPIGNIKDISYNAIDSLKEIDYIYCEDTRVTKKILFKYKTKTKNRLRILNDINEKKISKNIIHLLKLGYSVGIICDAGYPIFCDPGYNLIRECYKNKIKVKIIGANSAILSAIILSNLPPLPFLFYGFMNFTSLKKLKELLRDCVNANWISVFFVSKHDLKSLHSLLEKNFKKNVFVIVKEITKIHQTVYKGNGEEIIKNFLKEKSKGEFVFLIEGLKKTKKFKKISLHTKNLLSMVYSNSIKTKQLAQLVSLVSNEPINEIYKYIIDLKNK